MIIKKGCDCEWCEAVSWDVVGELRDTCEKLQQSLMMRGTRTPMIVSISRHSRAPREEESLLRTALYSLSLTNGTWCHMALAEVDRAELEALLQVKIEVSTDLREKLRFATEEIVDLRKQIHEQQERIAHLDLVRALLFQRCFWF
jgi:hypothetical protein